MRLYRVYLQPALMPRSRKRPAWILVEAEARADVERRYRSALRIDETFDRAHPRQQAEAA